MFQLVFYVPETHLEQVKEALFSKGAGCYNGYNKCCWQTLGVGQFQPLQGSNPFLGSIGSVEKVNEYKVEMICEEHLVNQVIEELIKVHPYEEPAYSIWQVITTKKDVF
jgi:structural toxin protein (hemagglutinin/hemolysin) RtxA